jgi:hypothetical protein
MVDVPLSTCTVLATRDELCSASEQLALAAFLAGYSALTATPTHWICAQYVAWCRDRVLRPSPRVPGSGSGHDRPSVARRGLLLPLRRTGRPNHGLAGGVCAPTSLGLRVPPHRPGPQRGRRHTGGRRLAGGRDHALISLLALNGSSGLKPDREGEL